MGYGRLMAVVPPFTGRDPAAAIACFPAREAAGCTRQFMVENGTR
jgi:hypothetical protein